MSLEDADRWDARYASQPRFKSFSKPRPFLVAHAGLLPPGGLALDIAMGLGGNAEFLLNIGFQVVGVDISGIALKQVKKRLPDLMAVQADLTRFFLPPRTFSVVTNFFYLQRDLWEPIYQCLRPGGILIFETLTRDMLALHLEADPVYYLSPGELRSAFSKLDILVYQEGWTESERGYRRAVASLIGRKV